MGSFLIPPMPPTPLPMANHANIFRERQLLFFLIRYGFDAEKKGKKRIKWETKAKCKDEVFVPTEVKKSPLSLSFVSPPAIFHLFFASVVVV